MSSVVPMKLVPVTDISKQTNNNNFDLPTLTTSSVKINDTVNNGISGTIGDLSNLDKELLEILHNNDLTEDAKARLYWVSLHKAEIYKDKSMWTEPVIVELRENRFIPVPIRNPENIAQLQQKELDDDNITFDRTGNTKTYSKTRKTISDADNDNITFDRTGNTITYGNKRKRIPDIGDVNDDASLNKRMRPGTIQPLQSSLDRVINATIPAKVSPRKPLQILPTPERVGTKRKRMDDNDREESELLLKRMAKANRVQSAISQGAFDANVKIGEPLVVYDTQDQTIPTPQSVGPMASNREIADTSASNIDYDILPLWIRRFFLKLEKSTLTDVVKDKIKTLVVEISEEDPNFEIKGTYMLVKNQATTSEKVLSDSNPILLLKNYVSGLTRYTRSNKAFFMYLRTLGLFNQTGSGLKNNIRKWVKL
jgi:hypothetical protein